MTSFHVGAAKIEERLGAGYAQGPSAQGHGVDLPVIGRFILIVVGNRVLSSIRALIGGDTHSQQTAFLSPVDVWK